MSARHAPSAFLDGKSLEDAAAEVEGSLHPPARSLRNGASLRASSISGVHDPDGMAFVGVSPSGRDNWRILVQERTATPLRRSTRSSSGVQMLASATGDCV